MKKLGRVIKPADATPWPHEERVAEILSKAGYEVEFIPEIKTTGMPDILLNGVRFEIKSPKSGKANTWEQRLKDATNNQSQNIVFDSSRIKGAPDFKVLSWLRSKYRTQPQIKKLIFIDKKGKITIDFTK